jgi:hypothetical protein
MKIILSPIASNKTTQVIVDGLTITVDGLEIDLSVIPIGGYAEADEGSPLIGKVTRDTVTVRYHYESAKAVPDQSADWDDYTFEVESGEVPCPIEWLPKETNDV